MQLNIRMATNNLEEIILGFVRINETNNLANVREFIMEQSLVKNDDFSFIIPGEVPISRKQETEMNGIQFLPSISIKIDKKQENLENENEKQIFFGENRKIIGEEESDRLVQENYYLKQELQNLKKTLMEKFTDNEILNRKQFMDRESISKLNGENKVLRKKLERSKNPELSSYSSGSEEDLEEKHEKQNFLSQNSRREILKFS